MFLHIFHTRHSKLKIDQVKCYTKETTWHTDFKNLEGTLFLTLSSRL